LDLIRHPYPTFPRQGERLGFIGAVPNEHDHHYDF
jgi:hypothetical protein